MPNVKGEVPAEVATEAAVEALPEMEVVEPEVTKPEVESRPEPEGTGRFESFEAVRPNGDVVVVTRNIDTGEQSVTDK
ncbi:hypothetical protein [Arthrobacter alpinus]|uniref:hypothetical protein n=1 Tax=Arthrobacter alpinus TaxID=656366 RepID=UPI000B0D4F2D|nr:hypothetical protein [Arthrobacter alpinus]